jgi:anti-sigma factor RsiW
MNCTLCKQELDAYREGRLPEGIRTQVEAHLKSCEECSAFYSIDAIANMVINEEKQVLSNPFLSTRVMAGIDNLEKKGVPERIPLYRRVLKPALLTLSIAAAVLIGIFAGNVYKPSTTLRVPVELSYINDAKLESVDLWSNN